MRRRLLTGISTNVLVLGLVSLLTDMSSEMIYPILPLFLAGIGATGAVIGLIEGAAETTASLLKVVSGWSSDRTGRRKLYITGGYSLSTVAKPMLFLATSYWYVLFVRITERIGKGIRSAPRDALIADSTSAGNMGRAYGFHKALDSTGAVIGPMLVIPVLLMASAVTVDTYRLIFLLATIPAFLAVLVIVLFVKEKDSAPKPKHGFLHDIGRLGKDFWRLMLIVLVFFVGEISYAFFVLKGHVLGYDTVTVILLYVLFNIVFVLISIPSGILSDRMGRRPVIALAFILFIITCGAMALADGLVMLAIGFALFGLYKGASEGVLKAFVTDVVPKELRGTALGAYFTAMGLVMLPGGLIAGLLWDTYGPVGTFGYGIATSTIALALLMSIGARR